VGGNRIQEVRNYPEVSEGSVEDVRGSRPIQWVRWDPFFSFHQDYVVGADKEVVFRGPMWAERAERAWGASGGAPIEEVGCAGAG
jgi:hypothetical protein